jgi:hypothetical protein
VFLGAPYARDVCFVDGKYVLFDEALKAKGMRPTGRIAFNVALGDTGEVKIFEQGLMFYADLKRVRGKFDLTKWAIEVQRHGAAKDPKTTYSILPDHPLSVEDQARFQGLVLHDLPAVYAQEAEGGDLDSYDRKARSEPSTTSEPKPTTTASTSASPGARTTEAAVVDEKTAEFLTTHLKKLPQAAVEKFCVAFGIAKIKALPASQTTKAMQLVDALYAEFDPPPATSVQPDPFE